MLIRYYGDFFGFVFHTVHPYLAIMTNFIFISKIWEKGCQPSRNLNAANRIEAWFQLSGKKA